MQITPKYKTEILSMVSYQSGNGLYVGRMVGYKYDKDKKTFVYTLYLLDGNCAHITEDCIHPLYSYITVDSEIDSMINIIERKTSPIFDEAENTSAS